MEARQDRHGARGHDTECGHRDMRQPGDSVRAFTPFMSGRLAKMLGHGQNDMGQPGQRLGLAAGTQLSEPQLLFEKIEDDAIQAQIDRLQAHKTGKPGQELEA